MTLLDTPGHVDFSAEMERTLQVLDYAVLVISGADGVQGHVETLWHLLERYHIPVFLFVNKMDQEGTDERALMEELKKRLSDECEDFSDPEDFDERMALHDEALLERFLEGEAPDEESIRELIRKRRIFPCFFGSALKMEGVEAFLQGLGNYMEYPWYPEEFGARVYKITRDASGQRLTHLKVTGGCLRVKMNLDEYMADSGTVEAGGQKETGQKETGQKEQARGGQARRWTRSGSTPETVFRPCRRRAPAWSALSPGWRGRIPARGLDTRQPRSSRCWSRSSPTGCFPRLPAMCTASI